MSAEKEGRQEWADVTVCSPYTRLLSRKFFSIPADIFRLRTSAKGEPVSPSQKTSFKVKCLSGTVTFLFLVELAEFVQHKLGKIGWWLFAP